MASTSRNGGRRSALDKPLPMRNKTEISLSAFAFLFSEFVQYGQQRVNTGDDLEQKCAKEPMLGASTFYVWTRTHPLGPFQVLLFACAGLRRLASELACARLSWVAFAKSQASARREC